MADDLRKISKDGESMVIPDDDDTPDQDAAEIVRAREIGGRDGPEPTRFGDWEKNGRCIDF